MSQPFVDYSAFSKGLDGWDFRYWLPPGRKASITHDDGAGLLSPGFLRLRADGEDDDGIFFMEKHFTADIEGPFSQCLVAWWFVLPNSGIVNQWPRVVYVGPPKDLARRETQKAFHWFSGMDGLTQHPLNPKWYGHLYKIALPKPVDKLMVCVGWKINWEIEREYLLDDITVAGF